MNACFTSTSTAYKVPVPPWLSAKDWTATGTVRSDNSISGPAQIKETSSVPVEATLAAADAAQIERYSHHRYRLSSVMTSLPQSQLTSLSPIPPQVTSRNQLHKAISAAMSIMPQTAVKLKLEMIRHYLKISISYMNMCIWEMVISTGAQRQAFSHSCCYKPCQLFRYISLQG